MILVVCALKRELPSLPPCADYETLACGIGPVEAACATARALATQRYEAVINAGIGGAFRGRARVGEALLIGTEALADFGLEGGAPLAVPGETPPVERVAADARLLTACDGSGLRVGSGVTVHQVTTTGATAARLLARYEADVESMEGFSVLRAAALAGVAAIEVRGISNYVDDRSAGEWNFAAGAGAVAHGLGAVLDRLRSR